MNLKGLICYLQVFHSLVGPEPRGDLGEQELIYLLHRLHHGVSPPRSGPDASHTYAGERNTCQCRAL